MAARLAKQRRQLSPQMMGRIPPPSLAGFSSANRSVNVCCGHLRSGAEVLGDLLEIEVFPYVLLPIFFFPPRVGVSFLLPYKRDRLCDGVPVRLGGLGILCTQLVNVGRGIVCCLLVLNLVSSTLPCIRQPRPRLRVLDICGFVSVCTQAFIGF